MEWAEESERKKAWNHMHLPFAMAGLEFAKGKGDTYQCLVGGVDFEFRVTTEVDITTLKRKITITATEV